MPWRIYAGFQGDPMFLLLENASNLNTPMRIPPRVPAAPSRTRTSPKDDGFLFGMKMAKIIENNNKLIDSTREYKM